MSLPTKRKPGPLGHPYEPFEEPYSAVTLYAPPPPDSPAGAPAFKCIPRGPLEESVRWREADPSRIDQAVTSLCGPASLLFILGEHRPGAYSRFIRDLYNTGAASVGKLHIKPGQDCKDFDPHGHIDPADWVGLASIRDSENTIFDYDDAGDAFAGITLPNHLASWFSKVGFSHVVNDTNLYLTKGEGNFRDAARLKAAGYEVCLFIDCSVIEKGSTKRNPFSQIFTCPNHWVVLTSDVNFDQSGNVHFTVYTWGTREHQVPPGTVADPLSLSHWLQNYYGYVACKA